MEKGDIWLVGIQERGGHGQHGTRPAVLITAVASDGMIGIVPLTSNLRAKRYARTLIIEPTKQNGLDVASVALITQSLTVDAEMLFKKIGAVEMNILREIVDNIHSFWG